MNIVSRAVEIEKRNDFSIANRNGIHIWKKVFENLEPKFERESK
jgi:hypothetical protein